MTLCIEPLDCGTLASGLSSFEDGESDQQVILPVPAWLIRHPAGLVLVDCGMHADLAGPSDYLDLMTLFFDIELGADQLVAGALAARGVDVADIDVVVLTHLHFDHAGGLGQIPNARVIVHADEWAVGIDEELAAANAFMQSDYMLGHDILAVEGGHDLFNDGRVTCIPTPGHTPGHQSVRVRLADQEVVLCGDCAYFERTLHGGALPPRSHNRKLHIDSIARLAAMGAAGARLIPGHDPDVLESLPTRLT